MASVFLAAFWVGRELDTFSSLAAAAGIILLIYPPSLFSISFQLSFSAVFAILFGLSRIGPLRQTGKKPTGASKVFVGARRYLIGLVIVSVFAIWGTFPLTMYYFNQFSVIGVVANLVVVPVIGFLVVPLGLAALCLWSIWQSLAETLMLFSATLLSWTLPVIDRLSDLPLASFTTWTPSVIEIACFYSISICALMLINRSSGRSLNKTVTERLPAPKGVWREKSANLFRYLPVLLQLKNNPKS